MPSLAWPRTDPWVMDLAAALPRTVSAPKLSRRERWALIAYGVASTLLTPVWLLRLVLRSRAEPLYRHALLQRLALRPLWDTAPAPPQNGPRLWLHAVSLGETRAARPLIETLRRQHPKLQLLLTHSTATGWQAGLDLLQPGDHHTWLPWDSWGATRRFVRDWRPNLGLLMETELWPQLVRNAAFHGVPVVIANARLSERSLRRGQRWSALLRPAARTLAGALAQSPHDAARLQAMGVTPTPVTGNLKFDMQPDPARMAQGRAWRAGQTVPVLLAAATREGEETELLALWHSAWRQRDTRHAAAPWPTLLLVPRHPQRFDEVTRQAQASGAQVLRRSQLGTALNDNPSLDKETSQSPGPRVIVGDSVGEMPMYYGMADLALLGGSFQPLGGQNLIESLACRCPIVLGPSTFNFDQAAQWALEHHLAHRCTGLSEAVPFALNTLAAWTSNSAHGDSAWPRPSTQAFDAAFDVHRGTAQRQALALGAWLAV